MSTYSFLTFEGKIADPGYAPNVWIVPASSVAAFLKQYRTRRVVSRALMLKKGDEYRNNWSHFIPAPGITDA